MQIKGKWVYDAISDPTRIVSKAMDYEFPNIIHPFETPSTPVRKDVDSDVERKKWYKKSTDNIICIRIFPIRRILECYTSIVEPLQMNVLTPKEMKSVE